MGGDVREEGGPQVPEGGPGALPGGFILAREQAPVGEELPGHLGEVVLLHHDAPVEGLHVGLGDPAGQLPENVLDRLTEPTPRQRRRQVLGEEVPVVLQKHQVELADVPVGGIGVRYIDLVSVEGTVGQALPSPVIVVVRTDAGAALADRTVAFQSAGATGGTFDPDTTVTNDQGQALTHWVLGTAPGPYTAEARLVTAGDTAVPAAQLQASAVAGAPDSVRADSPTLQSGNRGEPVAAPPVLVVVDRYGNPVVGVQVKWKVEQGNGELSPGDETVTDADGRSTVVWTLGNRIGVQQVKAEVKDVIGSPLTFTATVLF